MPSIRTTVDGIEKIVRQLESLGHNLDDQHLIIQQLIEKFPLSMLEKLEEARGDSPWTVTSLRKAVSNYVEVRERAERACPFSTGTLELGIITIRFLHFWQ